MTKSNDITLDNGDRQLTVNITVPSGYSEINFTCVAFNHIHSKPPEYKSAKLMIQGERNIITYLLADESKKCRDDCMENKLTKLEQYKNVATFYDCTCTNKECSLFV